MQSIIGVKKFLQYFPPLTAILLISTKPMSGISFIISTHYSSCGSARFCRGRTLAMGSEGLMGMTASSFSSSSSWACCAGASRDLKNLLVRRGGAHFAPGEEEEDAVEPLAPLREVNEALPHFPTTPADLTAPTNVKILCRVRFEHHNRPKFEKYSLTFIAMLLEQPIKRRDPSARHDDLTFNHTNTISKAPTSSGHPSKLLRLRILTPFSAPSLAPFLLFYSTHSTQTKGT